MNTDAIRQIEELIERYYDGSTSPEELQRLAALMERNQSLPPVLEAERAIIIAMASASPAPPADLEQRLRRSIAQQESAGDSATHTDRTVARRRLRRLIGRIGGAAAAAAAIAIAWNSFAPERSGGAHIITDDMEKMRYAEAALENAAQILAQAEQQLASTDSMMTFHSDNISITLQ